MENLLTVNMGYSKDSCTILKKIERGGKPYKRLVKGDPIFVIGSLCKGGNQEKEYGTVDILR